MTNFYDGWMKNQKQAMISCNDGFRPVSFLLEVID
ncbi:MAG: TIGR04076 family protein [Bacilli bacterium]